MRAGVEMILEMADAADLLEILVGEDRLAHFEALAPRIAFEIEDVRPRPDERDEAHHQLLADRVDRRVGHLREVLLEIGVEQLRLLRQSRDRRVGAHRADRLLAGRGHRRHQDREVFLACSRRPAGDRAAKRRCARRAARRGSVPRARSACGRAIPDKGGRCDSDALISSSETMRCSLEIDQQHLAGLQAPLRDDRSPPEPAARPFRRRARRGRRR